jgi:hypothetical protein
MTVPEGPRGTWLRPLALLGLALALSVGQPLLVVLVPFAFLVVTLPSEGIRAVLLGVLAFLAAFLGQPASGLWYVDRGWAILLGGWFAAVTVAWPTRGFFPRALVALAGATAWSAAVLLALDGWARVDWLIEERIRTAAAATLELLRQLSVVEGTALTEAVERTAEIQAGLFPALLGLSSLAGLGVAWWFFLRLTAGSGEGLGPLRNFRFPDVMIWVLIAGILMVMAAGWGAGWGRVGANLAVFMGALYALRGAAVFLSLSGGVGPVGVVLVAVGLLLAAPVVIVGAMVVGVGDSWVDLRGRARTAGGDADRN